MTSNAQSGRPLVSVLMGVYNCESTVGPSIESICNQTFADFEFIICDDGSSDGTYDAVAAYAQRDKRIRLIRNERNMGLSRTLNKCIELAVGRYLARMDGDDISSPNRFEKQVEFLNAHPDIALCGTSFEFMDDKGSWGELFYPEYPNARSFLLRSPFAHPTIMMRADAMRALGGYRTGAGVGRSEDYDLFLRLYAAGYRGYNFQDILFRYREDRASFNKRKLRYTITEAKVRARGYWKLGMMPWALPFVIKPLLVGLVPAVVYRLMRKAMFR